MKSEKGIDTEVDISTGNSKAVIEGKTTVSFQTLVGLILQRKVTDLFKQWGKDPVIVNSELLTGLASAPQDSSENRSRLILVTFGTGILAGVFVSAIAQILLLSSGMSLGKKELLLVAGVLVGLALLATALTKMQKKKKSDKLLESMEKLSSLLSK